MPFGNNDWLALTQESSLEPEIPICDPHHHLWDFRLERIPYQRYLLDELYADLNSGHNVRSTVFIEARSMYRIDGPEETRPVGEVEFVQGMAAAGAYRSLWTGTGRCSHRGTCQPQPGRGGRPGIGSLASGQPQPVSRDSPWSHLGPTSRHPQQFLRPKSQLSEEGFRAGARVLARMDLSLEAWMYFPQLPELVEFARAVPDLNIILNHIGGLLRIGPYANRDEEVLSTWR